MARNRRNQPVALRFGPALKAFTLCVLIGGAAVGYVWQKDQIRQLGQRFTEGEKALEALRRQNEKLEWELDALRSSASLEQLAQQRDLGLVQPSPTQVIRLPEPVFLDLRSPAPGGALQYAANHGAGPVRSY